MVAAALSADALPRSEAVFCSVPLHYVLFQAHGLVLKEALRSAWLQWARHGGLTTCPLTWHLKFPGLECIGLVLKKALRSSWLHGQVSVAD